METTISQIIGPLFPLEPAIRWELTDINVLILWGTEQGMSDLLLRSAGPAWMRLHGKWWRVTKKHLTANDLFSAVDYLANNKAASSSLKSKGADLDFAYEIEKSRGTRLRYRGNAAAIAEGYGTGIKIVLRSIPSEPPPLHTLNVERALLDHAFPQNGLVLITGVMGSGKTTFLASILREIVERGGRNVTTYEAPVEFSLDAIAEQGGPVSQSQVPQHFETFLQAVRNSTRAAPDVILIGESRDPETLRGMIESAEIGVAAYSTVHTRSVPETLTRIINTFGIEERMQIMSTLIASLRLIVSQRLVRKVDGSGRVALREFLPFTGEIKEQLFSLPPERLIVKCEELLFRYGQSMQSAAERFFKEGLISNVDYLAIMSERREISDAATVSATTKTIKRRRLWIPKKRKPLASMRCVNFA